MPIATVMSTRTTEIELPAIGRLGIVMCTGGKLPGLGSCEDGVFCRVIGDDGLCRGTGAEALVVGFAVGNRGMGAEALVVGLEAGNCREIGAAVLVAGIDAENSRARGAIGTDASVTGPLDA